MHGSLNKGIKKMSTNTKMSPVLNDAPISMIGMFLPVFYFESSESKKVYKRPFYLFNQQLN